MAWCHRVIQWNGAPQILAWHGQASWRGVPMLALQASTSSSFAWNPPSLEILLLGPAFAQHWWVFLFPSTGTPENMKTSYMSKFRVKEAYLIPVLWSLTQKSLRGGVKIEFERGKNGVLWVTSLILEIVSSKSTLTNQMIGEWLNRVIYYSSAELLDTTCHFLYFCIIEECPKRTILAFRMYFRIIVIYSFKL